MDTTLPMLAGTAATIVFVASVLPMLHKALRTRDLSSYSFGNIALANLGNAVQSVYVFSLPPGPIWVLHTFYLVSSGLMLCWYLRGGRAGASATDGAGLPGPSTDHPHPGLAGSAPSPRRTTPVS